MGNQKQNATFAQMVKSARLKTGKSIIQVTQTIGVSASIMSIWEKGQSLPGTEDIVRSLAQELNVPAVPLVSQYQTELKERFTERNTGFRVDSTNPFATMILQKRQALGLNRKELGQKAGINSDTIRAWEIGRRYPVTIEQVQKLAAALEIPLTDIQQTLPGGSETEKRKTPDSFDKNAKITIEDVNFLKRTLSEVGGSIPIETAVQLLIARSANRHS